MLHHYVIVRSDVPVGTLAAQIVHAAGESSDRVPKGTRAVVLETSSEKSLLRIERKLRRVGASFHAVREPDAPWNGALMAIGINPTNRDDEAFAPTRKVLRRLRLLRK